MLALEANLGFGALWGEKNKKDLTFNMCVCVFVRRVAVEVVSTKTTADVMWKDGRVEKGIRSNDLIPIQHLDSHEFCPGDFVVDKRREEYQLN